jgi:hypothetical protein
VGEISYSKKLAFLGVDIKIQELVPRMRNRFMMPVRRRSDFLQSSSRIKEIGAATSSFFVIWIAMDLASALL